MARAVRTASAERDILSIAGYIAGDKPIAAERWLDELDDVIVHLAHRPLLGEKVDYLSVGMRRYCFGKYLLFYAPIKDGIELRRASRRSTD